MEKYSFVALYSFAAVVFIILVVRMINGLTLWKISVPKIGWIEDPHRLDTVFLLSGIAFIWIARLPTLQFSLPLNPDEAMVSANAMRIWAGGMNWNNLDPATAGPLNSAVLVWPYLLGLDVTVSTTRMMGTAIISSVPVLLFLGIRCLTDTEIAVISIFPLFVFFASTSYPDFVHYSSEHLSVMLLSAGIYGFLRILSVKLDEKGQMGVPLLSALSLGLIFFAKLQAVPLAFLVGLFLIAAIYFLPVNRKQKWKHALLIICAAIFPSLMFLIPLLFRSEFYHFMNSYILHAIDYAGKPLSLKMFFHLVGLSVFYSDIFWLYAAVFGISSILYSFFPEPIATAKKWAVGLAVPAVMTAGFCVVRPGRMFEHYLHLMLPALVLSASVFYAIWSDAFLARMRSVRLQGAMHILVCSSMLFVMIPASKAEIHQNLAYQKFEGFRDGLIFKSPRLLQWLGTKKTDSLFIWGWMPQWFLSTGMTPATRETQTEFDIKPTPLINYYRNRLIQDFNKSRPDFVIDSVAPDSVFRFPGTQSVSSFPDLDKMIQNSFVMVSCDDPKGICPRLYVRKERLAEIQKNLISISRISASGQFSKSYGPEHVNDGNVFEFSHLNVGDYPVCVNYWLLPDASTGHITLEFDSTRVGSVSILNTRNGFLADRATERVRIQILQDEMILHQHELILNSYPYWTNYKLPEPVDAADRVRVVILSFTGRGAGLNKIQVYRE